jgi:hypothetical protein
MEDLVKKLDAHGKELYGTEKTLYNEIYHDAFSGWKVIRDARFPSMLPFVMGSTALDLGTHLGYFATNWSREGYQTTAVEYEEKFATWCRELMVLQGYLFDLHHQDCVEFLKKNTVVYDVASVISLYYHLFRRGVTEFLPLLVRSCRRLFIDDDPIHLPGHVLITHLLKACHEVDKKIHQARLVYISHQDGRKIYCFDFEGADTLPYRLSFDTVCSDVFSVDLDCITADFCPGQSVKEFVIHPSYEHYYAVFYRAALADFSETDSNTIAWLQYPLPTYWDKDKRRQYFYDLKQTMKFRLPGLVTPIQCLPDNRLYEGGHRCAIAVSLGISSLLATYHIS